MHGLSFYGAYDKINDKFKAIEQKEQHTDEKGSGMKARWKKLYRYLGDMKLEKKLLVSYLLFAVIPIIVIGSVICFVSFRIIIRQTRQYADMTIEQINDEMDDFVEKIERQAYSIYTESGIQDVLEHSEDISFVESQDQTEMIRKRLIGMWVTEKSIVGSYLCGVNGNSYFANINERVTMVPSEVFSKESWYQTITEGARKGVLTGIHSDDKYSDSSSLQLISYVHAVNSIRTGKYLGFLVIDIDASVFKEFVGEKAETLGGYIMVYDQFGNTMYSSERQNQKDRKHQGIVMEHTSPKTGWLVKTEIPWGQFIKEINRIMMLTAAAGTVCLILFAWMSRRISKSIGAPIRELQAAMVRVEGGDMDVKVTSDSDDEIGRLTRSFNHMVINIRELIEKVYLTQLGKKEAEFSALQSQINPHFMYNTLETVNMMAILDGSYEISDILTAFGKILRANLDQKHNIITVEKELEYINHYLMILQMRDKELFSFELHTTEEARTCKLPKLTLQPIVENSILHGFKEKMNKRSLRVEAAVKDNRLRIMIEDDGKGMTEDRLEYVRQYLEVEESMGKSSSIGLNNVNERCQLFFGDSFYMEIQSERGVGTRIILNMEAVYGERETDDSNCNN